MATGEHEPDGFWEPAGPVKVEEKIKRSLFIGHLFPCWGAADGRTETVRDVLARVEAEHRNATHNCWAYRLGPEPETEHSSDDGEPAGTAGRPILAAVRRSGMLNVMIVVTRYFGGVKLGVRGLIEAYGQTAEKAAAQAERIARIRTRKLVISLPYAIIGEVTYLLSNNGMVGAPEWAYGSKAEVVADVRVSAAPRITSALDELRDRNLIHSWSWTPLN